MKASRLENDAKLSSIGHVCVTTDGSRKRGLGVGVGTSVLRVSLGVRTRVCCS